MDWVFVLSAGHVTNLTASHHVWISSWRCRDNHTHSTHHCGHHWQLSGLFHHKEKSRYEVRLVCWACAISKLFSFFYRVAISTISLGFTIHCHPWTIFVITDINFIPQDSHQLPACKPRHIRHNVRNICSTESYFEKSLHPSKRGYWFSDMQNSNEWKHGMGWCGFVVCDSCCHSSWTLLHGHVSCW